MSVNQRIANGTNRLVLNYSMSVDQHIANGTNGLVLNYSKPLPCENEHYIQPYGEENNHGTAGLEIRSFAHFTQIK